MRVIAGEKGGRRLLAPAGRATRPTSDRVREAAFSMLESLDVLDGAEVWDLFAGSGAIGIEALSRGAAHATFVEQAGPAVSATRANLAGLGYGPERATVIYGDVLNWVRSRASALIGARPEGEDSVNMGRGGKVRVDIVAADPPYAWQGWSVLLGCLAPLGPVVLAETGEDLALPQTWEALRSKRYGGTVVTLARPRPNDSRMKAAGR